MLFSAFSFCISDENCLQIEDAYDTTKVLKNIKIFYEILYRVIHQNIRIVLYFLFENNQINANFSEISYFLCKTVNEHVIKILSSKIIF